MGKEWVLNDLHELLGRQVVTSLVMACVDHRFWPVGLHKNVIILLMRKK